MLTTCTRKVTFIKSPAIISPIGIPLAGFAPGNKTPPTRTLSSINTVLFGIGSVKMIFVAVVFPTFSNKTVYVKNEFPGAMSENSRSTLFVA
ncbi:hypothetical protein BMB171_C1431 [Bacillus thuringiensis BMB171]|nr:hypothetical protein BMB171_C1431 [Bacillus thuringiensis BMB171]